MRNADALPQQPQGSMGSAPGGFGAMLAGLLGSGTGTSAGGEDISRASARGDRAQAFEQARLLSPRAMELGQRPVSGSGEHPAQGAAPLPAASPPPAAHLLPPHGRTAEYSSVNASGGFESSAVGEISGVPQKSFAGIRLQPGSTASFFPAGMAPSPAAASAAVPSRALPASAPARVSSGATFTPPRGANASFLVRLLSQEDGALLVLRLPALPEAERAELQARVTAMLESFGHRRHRLIVQEISGGI